MTIKFDPLPTEEVAAVKARGTDAYGLPFTIETSDGTGTPCRHCLSQVPAGQRFLILAWRPFSAASSYAETGPIFLCEDDCAAAVPSDTLPPMLTGPDYCLRPYGHDDRIRYGHERIVDTHRIRSEAIALLSDPATAFVDIRNPRTGCYQARITRA